MTRRNKILIAIGIAALVLVVAVVLLFTYGRRKGETGLPSLVKTVPKNWYGFYYPGFKVPETPEEKKQALLQAQRFETFEECQAWGDDLTGGNDYFPPAGVDYTDPNNAGLLTQNNDGYSCGLNCKFDDATQDIVCDQKI